MLSLILKFVKFGLVGLSGFIIDFSLTYFLKEKIKVQKYAANSAGFITAATSNYFLNRLWTFVSRNPHILNEYTKFVIVASAGLLINNFFLWLLHQKGRVNFYAAKFLAVVITMFWNFTLNYLITFRG